MNHKHTHRTNLSGKPWISVYFRYLQFDNDRHPGLFGHGYNMQSKNVMVLFAWVTICVTAVVYTILFGFHRALVYVYARIYYFLAFLCAICSSFCIGVWRISRDSIVNRCHFSIETVTAFLHIFKNKKIVTENIRMFADWFHGSKAIVRWYYLFILLESM